MTNLLVDARDQKFVLHEMLKVEQLFETPLYGHLSPEVIDSSLDAALALAVNESYPIMVEADREGCRLEDGSVRVPRCFHRLKRHYDQGGFSSSFIPREHGGLGFPLSLWTPAFEDFVHNFGFLWPWASPMSATSTILRFGSEGQRKKYLPNLVSGKWGSASALTEDQAGADDLPMQTAIAVKQRDGSYRIKGTKPTVTNGDSDLFESMVLLVLARVQGDPADASGLSFFIVPKHLASTDGSLGPRNDYSVVGVERKLGLKGSPTVSINFGENGNCYAELLGERGQAMGTFISHIQRRLFYGAISTGIASAAYLHSVDHAKKRVQGVHISQANDPNAKRVAIVAQPFIRQRLLWMKSHVEGMRALVYYGCLSLDKANALPDPAEREKWSGIKDMLLPILGHYAAEKAFKVTEMAVKMHGRYGFFDGYPVHQFMRDIIPIGYWEGDASVIAMHYLANVLGQRQGQDFANLVEEMRRTIGEYGDLDGVKDLAKDLRGRVDLLGEMGPYFARCFEEGRGLVPISNGMPFVHFMGDICLGWMTFWQAGIAAKRLAEIFEENRIDGRDAARRNELLSRDAEAAFYDGKVHSARFFIKNVLPAADAVATAMRSEDLSSMAVHENSF